MSASTTTSDGNDDIVALTTIAWSAILSSSKVSKKGPEGGATGMYEVDDDVGADPADGVGIGEGSPNCGV